MHGDDGAFDVTVERVEGLALAKLSPQQMPRVEVARQLTLVGARDLVLDTNAGTTGFAARRGMALDLGGIAKLPSWKRACACCGSMALTTP